MDRISNLPDEIILHILSFLSTDEAALTSLLSTRWRNLFAFSPNLQFYENITKSTRQNYINFVGRVLAVSGNSTIPRFSLDARLGCDFLHTERWVRNVLSRGVLDLHLDIFAQPSIFFEVFTCNTLVKLKLADFYPDMLPEDASLPLLKTLSIDSVVYDSLEALMKLITACPLLEELIIDECYLPCDKRNECTLILSCPTLKKLTFKCFRDGWQNKSFDLPNFVNLDSLVQAKLKLVPDDFGNCNASNLVKGLRNVKILDLSSPQTLEIFGIFHEAMPVFNNLTHLSISSPRYVCSPGSSLPSLLEKLPNLHTLVIQGPLCHNANTGSDCKCFVENSHLSSCPVKVLELTKYEEGNKELEQMKHFLKGFPCLELVKVCACAEDVEDKMRITSDLQLLPRASSKCKIQVKF